MTPEFDVRGGLGGAKTPPFSCVVREERKGSVFDIWIRQKSTGGTVGFGGQKNRRPDKDEKGACGLSRGRSCGVAQKSRCLMAGAGRGEKLARGKLIREVR